MRVFKLRIFFEGFSWGMGLVYVSVIILGLNLFIFYFLKKLDGYCYRIRYGKFLLNKILYMLFISNYLSLDAYIY